MSSLTAFIQMRAMRGQRYTVIIMVILLQCLLIHITYAYDEVEDEDIGRNPLLERLEILIRVQKLLQRGKRSH